MDAEIEWSVDSFCEPMKRAKLGKEGLAENPCHSISGWMN